LAVQQLIVLFISFLLMVNSSRYFFSQQAVSVHCSASKFAGFCVARFQTGLISTLSTAVALGQHRVTYPSINFSWGGCLLGCIVNTPEKKERKEVTEIEANSPRI
jgi:hypothetical protein